MGKKSYQIARRQKVTDRKSFSHLRERLAKCEKDLEEIRKDLAYIRETDSINLGENPSYHALLADEHAKLNEINRLKDEISSSVIVEETVDENVIGLGDTCTLELTYPDDDEPTKRAFTLVGSSSNPFSGEISKDSPIGMSILGKTVGTVVEATLPSGATVIVKIISKE